MNSQKDNLEELFNTAKRESLTTSERISMRNSIQLFMSEHPLQASFFNQTKNIVVRVLNAFDPATPRARFVPAALALVLVVGVGTSYAAENALPGDVLYPVKIYFNESIEGSLAVSQASKADWNTQLMTRRLEEAETLTSEDRLTAVARTDIQTQLLKSADNFDQNVAALAQTSDGASAIATVQSNLEASLASHVQVLSELTADVPQVQDAPVPAGADVAPIAAIAQAQVDESHTARISAEAIVASSTSTDVAPVAFAAKAMATKAVATVQNNVATTLSAESTTTVSTHTAAHAAFKAEQTVASGNEKLDRGEYAKAFTIFQAAIRAARSAQVHLDASQRLDIHRAGTNATDTND